MRKTTLAGATGLMMMLLLTGCGSVSHQPGEAAPAGSAPAASASASATAPAVSESPGSSTPGAPAPTTTAPTSVKTTASAKATTNSQTVFKSPTGNITCEIDYNQTSQSSAYCQTDSPPESVTLTAAGAIKTCTTDQCLGDAGEGTPTLAYGKSVSAGPFHCASATIGITCTANGKGFRISNSGVTPVTV